MSNISSMALKQAKAALRAELKARLAAMTNVDRKLQSNTITQMLTLTPEYQTSKRVCLYLSMPEEVNTYGIMKHALQNKECFIPQYIGPVMKMVKLESFEDYEKLPETKWKIKQPADSDIRPDALETGGLDLILLPGLGFTLQGDRLGRGKGYYDTYLQKCKEKGFNPRTVGLAYSQQICDSIPVSETDQKVDFILTPT
ncbi:5-formyltetrahydrofolate cyclo-ligase-like [Ruditapes philippinarum]|uniref:5-formyltetrahydrofolate cyclo-ligase-like n=1 Tax=Ruditapes philippinarum TaxID=129788 RepID=UPI00295B3243|nr:5-formyltetrahydrofolate cyclo-ligase-like [Ruditapes philippinarum]